MLENLSFNLLILKFLYFHKYRMHAIYPCKIAIVKTLYADFAYKLF